jgi:hypothetical protein
VAGFKVLIDDNYHFTDESERITHGTFDTAAQAVAACQAIVDEFLIGALKPGMTVAALYEVYTNFGDDPFIMPVDPKDAPVAFSAWAHACERCAVLAGLPPVA